MGRIEKSIEIRAPPRKVWEMLALDRFPEWEEGYKKDLKSMEYTSEVRIPKDKYKVGASAHLDTRGEGGMDVEITESLKNEKITYHTKRSGTNQQIGSITFISEPIEEGTKFTYVYDYEMPYGILGKFLEKLFLRRYGVKQVERSLEDLKNILEK